MASCKDNELPFANKMAVEMKTEQPQVPEARRIWLWTLASLACPLYLLYGFVRSDALSWLTPQSCGFVHESPKIGSISWFDCPNPAGAECGQIVVPLNHLNHSEGTSTIFLGRIKATAHPKQGTLFFNPGGPGGLGFDWFTDASVGPAFVDIVGKDWDLVGFDPRGIGRTTPAVRCFPNYMDQRILESNTVLEQGFTVGTDLDDPATRDELVMRYREFLALKETEASMCALHMGSELAHMGTTTIVRDLEFMTNILDGDDAPINFWGDSYGSIIGAYLVNMYPNRTGRVLIDGIVNPVLWANAPSQYWPPDWMNSTEGTYALLLDECVKAGSDRCALASFASSASELDAAIESFIAKLYVQPMSVPVARRPGYLTAGAVRALIFDSLKFPHEWSKMALHLSAAMNGNGTLMLNDLLPSYLDEPGISYANDMTRLAVACLDSPPPANKSEFPTAEELADLGLKNIREVSPHFGMSVSISEPDGGCQFWPVQPPERFAGPFNATLKNPMLIVSNTLDPNTPLASGRLVNQLMPDSTRLLIQDCPGHSALALTSICGLRTIRDYFADGTLPENEAHCPVDEGVFPPVDARGETQSVGWAKSEGLTEEEQRMVRGAKALGEATARWRRRQ